MCRWLWNRGITGLVGTLVALIPIMMLSSVISAQVEEPVTAGSVVDDPRIPFVVNSTGDTPDVDPADGICAIDQGTDVCTLRAAVQQANATIGHDTITFDLSRPATIRLQTEIVINDALTISGPGIERLLIDGNNEVRHFVIDLIDTTLNPVVALAHLTLANGQPLSGNRRYPAHGGSIYYADDTSNGLAPKTAGGKLQLELTGVLFRNNASPAGAGGALYIGGHGQADLPVTRSAYLNDVTFADNYAKINGGAIANFGVLTIENSRFTVNQTDNDGGALFSRSAAELTLANTVFTSNGAAKDGGALNNQGGNVLITGGELNQNRAGDDGGAVYNIPLDAIGTTLTISGSVVMNNHADQFGGAVYNGASAPAAAATVLTTVVSIVATDLISNSAGISGGALYSFAQADSALNAIRHHHVLVSQGTQFIRNAASDSGGALYVGTGRLTVSDSLLQANRVTFVGEGGSSGGAIAVVDSIVQLTNSEFINNGADDGRGGAVASDHSRVEIVAGNFLENSARHEGGAVACWADAPDYSITNLTFRDTLLQGNSSQNGGAVALNSCTWAMDNANLENNRADNVGGAIFSINSVGTIMNSLLSGNQAPTGIGGAIYIIAQSKDQSYAIQQANERSGDMRDSLAIVNSSLLANVAGMHGGAIYNQLTRVSITDSTLSQNNVTATTDRESAVVSGGGAILNNGLLTLNQSTFSDNKSGMVGGALLNTATAFLTDSTFSGNMATSQGGAIYNVGVFEDSWANLTINLSTITANRALEGGGIVNGQLFSDTLELIIGSTILAGNMSDGLANECLNNAVRGGEIVPFQSLGYNVTTLEESATCQFDGPSDQILPADQIFSTVIDQQLADNGGSTPTHALLAGSPAIDQVPRDVNDCGTTIEEDQRGVARPIGATCDIGAYEAIEPMLSISKTVGIDPESCAPTSALTVDGGTVLYYCLTVKNGDHITVNQVQIDDPTLHIANVPFTVTLVPGSTHRFTHNDLPALGSVKATHSATNTIAITAETVPLPVTGEQLSVRAVASATVEIIPTYTITLSRPVAVKLVGQQQIITATVVDHNDDRVVGQSVQFAVQGTNSQTASTMTEAGGVAHFAYLGTVNMLGTDTITARIPAAQARAISSAARSLDATAAITAAWRPITITIHGVDDGTASVAERTITALVQTIDGDQLVDGLQVGFMVTGTNIISPQFAETAKGQASFDYVSLPPAAGSGQPALANRQAPRMIMVAYHPSQQRQTVTDDGLDHIYVWVDLNRNRQFDEGEPQAYRKIAAVITLVSFDAERNPDGSVTVAWRTAVELDNAGFNLYRAPYRDGPFTKLNDQLIAAQGMGMEMGASYQYVDVPPTDAPFYYLLEDVDFYGVRTQHGPIRRDEAHN